MSTDSVKVIHSYCYYNTESWAIFTVNDASKRGDIFKITRSNLRECFSPSNSDLNIPQPEEGAKRVTISFSKAIPIIDSSEEDILIFTFDSDAEENDTFILYPDILLSK